jgi:hypothetical protein
MFRAETSNRISIKLAAFLMPLLLLWGTSSSYAADIVFTPDSVFTPPGADGIIKYSNYKPTGDVVVNPVMYGIQIKEIAPSKRTIGKSSSYDIFGGNMTSLDLSNTNITYMDGLGEYYKTINTKWIKLPDTLKEVGDFGFLSHNNLETINSNITGQAILPEGLEKTGVATFRSTKLKDIRLPKSFLSAGEYSFALMPELKYVTAYGKIPLGKKDDSSNHTNYQRVAFTNTTETTTTLYLNTDYNINIEPGDRIYVWAKKENHSVAFDYAHEIENVTSFTLTTTELAFDIVDAIHTVDIHYSVNGETICTETSTGRKGDPIVVDEAKYQNNLLYPADYYNVERTGSETYEKSGAVTINYKQVKADVKINYFEEDVLINFEILTGLIGEPIVIDENRYRDNLAHPGDYYDIEITGNTIYEEGGEINLVYKQVKGDVTVLYYNGSELIGSELLVGLLGDAIILDAEKYLPGPIERYEITAPEAGIFEKENEDIIILYSYIPEPEEPKVPAPFIPEKSKPVLDHEYNIKVFCYSGPDTLKSYSFTTTGKKGDKLVIEQPVIEGYSITNPEALTQYLPDWYKTRLLIFNLTMETVLIEEPEPEIAPEPEIPEIITQSIGTIRTAYKTSNPIIEEEPEEPVIEEDPFAGLVIEKEEEPIPKEPEPIEEEENSIPVAAGVAVGSGGLGGLIWTLWRRKNIF